MHIIVKYEVEDNRRSKRYRGTLRLLAVTSEECTTRLPHSDDDNLIDLMQDILRIPVDILVVTNLYGIAFIKTYSRPGLIPKSLGEFCLTAIGEALLPIKGAYIIAMSEAGEMRRQLTERKKAMNEAHRELLLAGKKLEAVAKKNIRYSQRIAALRAEYQSEVDEIKGEFMINNFSDWENCSAAAREAIRKNIGKYVRKDPIGIIHHTDYCHLTIEDMDLSLNE